MTTIDAFDVTRRTNATLMADCSVLGYLIDPVIDLTAGTGAFWSLLPDLDVHLNDLDPAKGRDSRKDFTATPWEDRSWGSVVYDPPYALRGASSDASFEDRYGLLGRYRSIADMRAMIEAGAREAVRIADSFTLIKVQDHVSSGVLRPLTVWATVAAEGAGAELVDTLHVVGGRAQPHGRRQVRARHAYSTLLVLRRRGRRRRP